MAYSYSEANRILLLDAVETVRAAGKTIAPRLLVWSPTTAGHALTLTDANDEPFVGITGVQYGPVVIRFPHGTKLDGLKVTAIGSGTCYLYLQP